MSDGKVPVDLFGFPVAGASGVRQLPLGLSLSRGGSSYRLQVFRPGAGNATSLKDVEALEAGLGQRWAAALRKRYPQNAAKLIARDFEVAERTAKGWLADGAPFAPVLVRAARLFGAGILGEVLMPGSDLEKAAHLDQVLGEIEGKIAELGDELVVLKRGDHGGADE